MKNLKEAAALGSAVLTIGMLSISTVALAKLGADIAAEILQFAHEKKALTK